jgi:hypothetical protein
MSSEISEIISDLELQRILIACLDYCSAESCAPTRSVICYSWVARCYETRFGGTFHQSRLAELERLGVLAKDGETSRCGDRRYYRVLDPAGLARLLNFHQN